MLWQIDSTCVALILRQTRALLVYHSFLPMSHICHSPKLQGIACALHVRCDQLFWDLL